jgi:CRISPR-associated protein Csb2
VEEVGTTTLAIRYVSGQVHATPWDRHPNEAVVEWPPSPWRILRALYAVWRERVPDLPALTVESLLRALAERPPTYRLPPAAHAHTRHWYPTSAHRSDAAGYARSLALDGFMAVDHRTPAYVTFDADLDDAARAALETLVERLTYLGRAESAVQVEVVATPHEVAAGYVSSVPADASTPLSEETPSVLVPEPPLDLARLTATTSAVQRRRLTLPPGARRMAYTTAVRPAEPAPASRPPRPAVHAAMWQLTGPVLPAVRMAVVHGEAIHRAVLHQYGGVTNKAHSPLLSGKDAAGQRLTDDHGHAHVLLYDLDGDRRLDTAVLWVPAGLTDDREVQAVAATRGVQPWPWITGFHPVGLSLVHLGSAEGLPAAVRGPARTWTSLTPFAPAHHAKRRQRGGPGWEAFVADQVRRACRWRGLAEPADVELLSDEPWLQHRRHRARETLQQARRAVGLRLTFDDHVDQPLPLGALSHFGLGVFVTSEVGAVR